MDISMSQVSDRQAKSIGTWIGGMPNSPRSSPNAVRVIDVLTYPAVQLLDVSGPVQVFASANDLVVKAGGTPPYFLKVVAQRAMRARRVASPPFAQAHSCSRLRAY
jgi:hypothetical protein